MQASFLITILFPLLLIQTTFQKLNNLELLENIDGKYKVGDMVKCSQWQNDSYWEGRVVRVLKEVVYQVELKTVYVNGFLKLQLNSSECTGKKTLTYRDGEDYDKTKIWVHERCLN